MNNKEFRKMKYTKNRTVILLDSGKYLGFEYYILSLGIHPTCYIKIPKKSSLFGEFYDDINIDCHGGLTFSSNSLPILPLNTKDDWFIGWDYAHYRDYSGYNIMFKGTDLENKDDKKWTTEEIQKEVYKVCNQLKDGK